MILARFCFMDLDTLIFAQLSEHLSDILFDLSVYDLSPVFRRKYDMILHSHFVCAKLLTSSFIWT